MLPRSLYIHIPWCIRKCPYCDFNSHTSPDQLPEEAYVDALLADFRHDISTFPCTSLSSIFIGGGTPSLFSAQAYARLFNELSKYVSFESGLEITLEANPGTIEQQRFNDYRALGINRLSLGIQSFNPHHLKTLGRIHDDAQAHAAIHTARRAGFDNLNIDLMYSLPHQSINEGLNDLQQAISHAPEHISWYQLTIEPNTVFYKQRPPLPSDEDTDCLEEAGYALLEQHSYQRYEISAYSQVNKRSKHNLNYWLFGDYYGIGAGAHGKLTTSEGIFRTCKHKQPKEYLNPQKSSSTFDQKVAAQDALFEFMLNTSRLTQPIEQASFTARTGLPMTILLPTLLKAQDQGLVDIHSTTWQVTTLGRRFTNDLIAFFLP